MSEAGEHRRDDRRSGPRSAGPSGESDIPERLARLQGQRLYRVAGLLFLLALLFRYFDSIVRVLLIAFVGVILGVALNAAVKRLPFSRGISTAVLALATLLVLATAAWFAATFLVGQVRQLIDEFPAIVAAGQAWIAETLGVEIELIGPAARDIAADLFGMVDGFAVIAGAFGVVEVLAIGILVLVGAFFIVGKPDEQLLEPLLRAIPARRRPPFRRMLRRLGERLSAWLWGTLISMGIIGALAVAVFYFMGVPYALLLGVLVGLFDLIPLVGPWLGGAIAVVVTLFEEPGLALWVALAILVIQEVEGNLVRPFVMSESARLHPFVTLLALLLFTSLFGVLGAILSLPITLALATIVEVLWVEETLGGGEDEIEPVVG